MKRTLGYLLCILFWSTLPAVGGNMAIDNSHSKIQEKGFYSKCLPRNWEEYLVSGNGIMGLMVAGNPYREEMVLNHTNLFMPIHEPLTPPSQGNHLEDIKQMMLAGQYQEASSFLVDLSHADGFGRKRQSDLFIPAFQLNIESDTLAMRDFRRSVNFLSGEIKVEWKDKRGKFVRHSFVSRTDNVAVTEIKAQKGRLNMAIDLETINRFDPKRKVKFCLSDSLNIRKVEQNVTTDRMYIKVWYEHPWKGGYEGYDGVIRLRLKDGKAEVKGQKIVITSAKELILLAEVQPVRDMDAPSDAQLDNHLNSLIERDYASLLGPHRDWQMDMMQRVTLNLNADEHSRNLPSEKLLQLGGSHPAVIEQLFDAARYNILSATGENPPNLQGIWGATMTPPWAGDYTTNGNLPTAVSHYLAASTPELMLPLFNKLESQMEEYRTNARVLFGCKGIHIPSHIQLHGYDNQFDATWPMTFWTAGAAWYSLFYYDYYLYTGDEKFLKERALPFMLESVQFYEDFLTDTDENGKLVFNPSYSPENNPKNSKSQACINATMDIALCKALLRDLISISEKKGIFGERLSRWKKMLAQMPDYQVNDNGELREWTWKDLQDNHQHRHASHLIGLYYRHDPEIMQSYSLRQGALNALLRRLDYRKNDSGVMAFGLSQLAFPACALGQGEIAGEMLAMAGDSYFNNNLMTTHDPHEIFNTDMSGAYPAIVMQMLAYSDVGIANLLPALPPSWKKGRITGMSLRGGVRLKTLEWDGAHGTAVFVSNIDQTIKVSVRGGESKELQLLAKEPTSFIF